MIANSNFKHIVYVMELVFQLKCIQHPTLDATYCQSNPKPFACRRPSAALSTLNTQLEPLLLSYYPDFSSQSNLTPSTSEHSIRLSTGGSACIFPFTSTPPTHQQAATTISFTTSNSASSLGA